MEEKDLLEYENIGRKIKRNDKYNYVSGKQIEDQGTRIYDVAGFRLPSVTTILSRTKDQEFIKKWKAKVGEKEAERIKNLSSMRGTAMHKFLESHIEGIGYEDLTEVGKQAKSMAQKVIDIGLAPVDEYYGSEVTNYPGLYAGQTDLVCIHDGNHWILNNQRDQNRKTGSMTISYKLLRMQWRMTMFMVQKFVKV